MHPWCILCYRECDPKLQSSASPMAPPCGHIYCHDCLERVDNKQCLCRSVISSEEARPIRMKFIECGNSNWQELLSSKARKRLQKANDTLQELKAELDEERAKLARTLAGFAANGSFEKTLQSLAGNLTESEEASIELYPQILVYSKMLEELEAEIKKIKGSMK